MATLIDASKSDAERAAQRASLQACFEFIIGRFDEGAELQASLTRGTRDATKPTDSIRMFEMTNGYTLQVLLNGGAKDE